MPFYGANITYIAEIETEECTLVLDANYYRGALIGVSVDGADAGNIVYSPYNLEISGVSKGRHKSRIHALRNEDQHLRGTSQHHAAQVG